AESCRLKVGDTDYKSALRGQCGDAPCRRPTLNKQLLGGVGSFIVSAYGLCSVSQPPPAASSEFRRAGAGLVSGHSFGFLRRAGVESRFAPAGLAESGPGPPRGAAGRAEESAPRRPGSSAPVCGSGSVAGDTRAAEGDQ